MKKEIFDLLDKIRAGHPDRAKLATKVSQLIQETLDAKRRVKTPEQKRLDQLEHRIKELEDKISKQVPWSPPPFDDPNSPITPQPTIPNIPVDDEGVKCPTCGMVWKGLMCYSCPNNNCPMGAGPTMFDTKL
jgi:hypothetical protein